MILGGLWKYVAGTLLAVVVWQAAQIHGVWFFTTGYIEQIDDLERTVKDQEDDIAVLENDVDVCVGVNMRFATLLDDQNARIMALREEGRRRTEEADRRIAGLAARANDVERRVTALLNSPIHDNAEDANRAAIEAMRTSTVLVGSDVRLE